MNLKSYLFRTEFLQQKHDKKTGRKYNKDSFGHWERISSRYVSYFLFKTGLKGQHALFTHFLFDLAALTFVIYAQPVYAMLCWLIAHYIDQMDGDLARIRKEAHPKWGEIDVMLHLVMNMFFWVILFLQHFNLITFILAFRVILEYFRAQHKVVGERWGERSRFWMFASLPTNINILYFSFGIFASIGFTQYWIDFYFTYYFLITLGQITQYIWNRIRHV